jgi:hypothetical protein
VDPKYVDVIVQRWQQYTGKKALLDADGRSFDKIAEERRQRDWPPCAKFDLSAPSLPNNESSGKRRSPYSLNGSNGFWAAQTAPRVAAKGGV